MKESKKGEEDRIISSQLVVSLTTDHWTSLAIEAFITVTTLFKTGSSKTTEMLTGENIDADLNPFKPSVLFVGHRQTVHTQIRRHRTRRLIKVSTVCLQTIL